VFTLDDSIMERSSFRMIKPKAWGQSVCVLLDDRSRRLYFTTASATSCQPEAVFVSYEAISNRRRSQEAMLLLEFLNEHLGKILYHIFVPKT